MINKDKYLSLGITLILLVMAIKVSTGFFSMIINLLGYLLVIVLVFKVAGVIQELIDRVR